jgi:predicted nucleic acid-binding protein
VVSLQEAATRLGKDPRTVIRAITTGELRGGAMPRPERLRWYVYADALPGQIPAPPPVAADLGDLRAQVVSLSEANRLLIAAQQELLDADRATNDAAEKYRAVARNYLDALAQFMTPGNLGDLADL